MPLSETEKRGRGRPKTGKVLFAKRVSPEMAARLTGLISKDRVPDAAPVAVVQPKVDTSQVRALLDDVEKKEAEIADLKARLERCAMATDDQKATYWMRRALKAEGAVKKGEFDQT